MITATSRNILPGGGGHAIICSPEEVLVEARRPGVFTATVDLARVSWLRDQVDRRLDTWPWRTKPGIFKQWLRRSYTGRIENTGAVKGPPAPALVAPRETRGAPRFTHSLCP